MTRRCMGVNAAGVRCGREAAPARDRCYLHDVPGDPEPSWRYRWDGATGLAWARRLTLAFPAAALRAAELAGEFNGPAPTRPCDNHLLRMAREARVWLARHDPEWLALADSGALRNAAGKRPAKIASRPRACGSEVRETPTPPLIEGLPPGAVKREDGSWIDPRTGDEYDVEEVESE